MRADFLLLYKDVGATPSPFDFWLNSCNLQILASLSLT
jgi:hypothetical protein